MSEDRTSEEATNAGLTYNIPLAVGLGGITVWLLYALYVRANFCEKDRDAIGAFGDAFGAINPLLTIVAIVGAFFAVMYQREDLRQAKVMLRHEMRKSESERIERHFFLLLDLLKSNELKVQVSDCASGLPSFAKIHSFVRTDVDPPAHSSHFSEAFPSCEGWLQVFRLLIEQIRKLPPSERPFLVELLESQLAKEQLVLLCDAVAFQQKWLKELAPIMHEVHFMECLLPHFDAKPLLYVWRYLRSKGYKVGGE